MTLTDMVQICIKENTLDFFEQLLNSLLKTNDRTLLFASRQIVDTLVDNVLTLDSKMASGESNFFFIFLKFLLYQFLISCMLNCLIKNIILRFFL